jgi:hypothetical protein
MGNATKSHRAYYYENNPKENNKSKVQMDQRRNESSKEQSSSTRFALSLFEELLEPLLENKIYNVCVPQIENTRQTN